MEKAIKQMSEIIREIRKDFSVYMAIQRYARVSRKSHGFISVKKVTLTATILLVFLMAVCHADTAGNQTLITPEPGSVALVSTGIFGYIISFARRRFREFKRIFDVIASAVGIALAAPVIALTALIIKIVSPGPAFYAQDRVGQGGEIFRIYKMRTMRVDAEKSTGPVWAQENDPRLIKFGDIIRKLHVDELPQLFNVLKGDMSIVGPRPERPVFVTELSAKISD